LIFAIIQRLINIAIVYHAIKWTEAIDLSLLKLENFFGMNFVRNVGNGILVYLVITGILYGYMFYLKNRMQEKQQARLTAALSKLKIENLKYQLQPHFLFNSLQSISTLIHRDTKAADQALGDLGDLLRYSIRNIDTEKVTLGEELMSLQKFIDLQQTRFAEKLKVAIDFEEGVMEALVPAFLLQPIIENSIKHNIEETGEPVEVHLWMTKVEEKLILKIQDDGDHKQGLSKTKGNGIGIKNLKLRLEALYQNNQTFTSQYLEHAGFQTIIEIPFEQ
jgi:LytS/YehU family sensor histidine kinase